MNRLVEARSGMIIPYDTTLRDGAQDPRARLSVERKLNIAKRLEEWGVPYIEGGWPGRGEDEIDTEFFKEAKGLFQTSELIAFGMTARIGVHPANDDGLNKLLESETGIITIVGKTWLQHVKRALRTEGLPNLDTIHRSIEFLTKQEHRDVFFDAEHWFDGYRQDPEYAIAALEAAVEGGAKALIPCDTRGSCTPEFIYKAMTDVKNRFPHIPLGIHVHNDGGEAVSATIAAVKAGATQVQGTINGVGERTGNVDMCVVLPRADFAYGIKTHPHLDLRQVTPIARFVEEQNEIILPDNNPYTGRQVFTHKAGLHGSGQQRDDEAYEATTPESVGNKRFYVMSEQGGWATVEAMARKHDFELSRNDPSSTPLVDEMRKRKVFGDAQEFLLLHEFLSSGVLPFEVLDGSRVIDTRGGAPDANVRVHVNGDIYHEAAEGDGLINAFDLALKKALAHKYPEVHAITLGDNHDDYKVTKFGKGTAAEVEVFARFVDSNGQVWTSRVRGTDQQRAGEDAIVQAYQYHILKGRKNEWTLFVKIRADFKS